MNQELIRQMYAVVIAQTVAFESFQPSIEGLIKVFEIQMDTKYKEMFTVNRANKKKLKAAREKELADIKKTFDRYMSVTLKMVSHFDQYMPEELDDTISEVSDFLQEKIQHM